MFIPPRCPVVECPAHVNPRAFPDGFFICKGSYHPKCRARPVPRFKCRICEKGFSRQTFRMDYCDNKPHHNAELFKLLASGMGLRQSGRLLELSRRCVELKARKISRHLRRINRNLTDRLPEASQLMLDELVTFETDRSAMPVSVPILIESRSGFVLATDVAAIKPSGKLNDARRDAIARAQARFGPRVDNSKNALCRVFRRLGYFGRHLTTIPFVSDKKQLYGSLLRRFAGEAAAHLTVSSKEKRDAANPLHPINLTNAMARDLNGRLRRESWLASKQRRYLRLQLYVFAAYRNFVRKRTNRDPQSPAQKLGFVTRRLRFEELLTWRQDWKWFSVHPVARGVESVSRWRDGRANALEDPVAA